MQGWVQDFHRLIQDLRFALRQLIRYPAGSALLVLTVAVAIGANVAIFSVLEGIVLRPLPYAEADRLLAVWETPETRRWHQPFNSPDYFDVREQSQTLEEFGVTDLRWMNLSGGEGEPVRLRVGAATASLFQLLGVQPVHGRLFTEGEEAEGAHRVAVLSHGLWQSQFAGDPEVVGRQVTLDGEAFEIIGIMPPGFRFPNPWGGRDGTRLWTPIVLERDDGLRGSHWLGAFGKMANGVTPEGVEAELNVIAERLASSYPGTNAQTRMWVQPLMASVLRGVGSSLVFLMVAVGVVLLTACANVASMLLARGMNRASEFAIRASLGADRRGLVRQLLTESLLLTTVGGLAGVLLAYWGVDALRALLPENVPRAADIRVNLQVLGFAAAVTALTGLLVGLAPALFASRSNLAEVIKHNRASRGGDKTRFLSGLVAAQLAMGFVLVNAAVVLAVSYGNVLSLPMNFATDEVVVTSLSLAGPAYREPEQRGRFWEELAERARLLPGVVQAGVTSKLPLQGGINGGVLVRDQVFDPAVQDFVVEYSFVDEGYHEAMGIPLLRGRTFDQRDLDVAAVYAGQDSVIAELPLVINRTMAETLWPDADALGELVRPYSSDPGWHGRVVGIVEDVRQWGPEVEPQPEMYFPHTAEVWGPISGNLIVRGVGGSEVISTAIRQTVHDMDAAIPSTAPVTMGRILRASTSARRFSLILVGLFAGTALLLIVAGTYGVLSYAVSQRTHEIGVRMTLGADKASVMRLFLVRVGRLVGTGLALGFVGAFAASVLTTSMVFGISPVSPVHMAAAAGIMVVVGFAATVVPVRRATGADPLESLRAE